MKYEIEPITFPSGAMGFGVIAYAPVVRHAAVHEEWLAEEIVKLLRARDEARLAEAATASEGQSPVEPVG